MPAYPPTYKKNVRDAVRGNLKLYEVTDLQAETIKCLVAAALDLSERHAAQYNQVTARRVGEVVVTAYIWEDHPIHFFVNKFVEACEAGDSEGAVIVIDMLNPEEMKAYKRWVRQFWG